MKYITLNFEGWNREVNDQFIGTRLFANDGSWTPFITVNVRYPGKGITFMDGFMAGEREGDRPKKLTDKEVVEIISASAHRCSELEKISNKELHGQIMHKVWGNMVAMSEEGDIVDEAMTRILGEQPTTEPPTEPGWYPFNSGAGRWIVIKVYKNMNGLSCDSFAMRGYAQPVKNLNGLWGPKIEFPK
ncbi:hypothetical protein KAR91_26010 [Candidatus Pacearchaeota archaeon]|nr:hypothetical protein [Candidatus Pacearchaeota archaeon]